MIATLRYDIVDLFRRYTMSRLFVLGLVLVLGLTGCMEEEKTSSVKLQVSEIQPADSGGQDLGVLDDTTDHDAGVDAADANSATEEVADAEVGGSDTDDVATADEVSGSTDAADADTATEEVADADAADAEDVVIPIDVTEIQDSQDVLEINEDADAASEIAEDVSVVVDVDVSEVVDAEVVVEDTADSGGDIDQDLQEVADSDVQTDVEQDIPPDAPPDVTSQDAEIDVSSDISPPDPCLTLNCDDKNPCTLDSCDKVAGCSNAPTAATCEDGDACTVGDACALGSCKAGTTKKCNDGNLCTTDSCDAKLGCVFANNVLPCEDGDSCTEGEKCGNGACVAGQVKNCSDGNVCTSDVCDQTKGCVNAPMTGSCNDGNACTDNDKCSAGVCSSGTAKICDDGNVCTSNVCDAANGCKYAQNWVVYGYKDATLTTEWSLTGDMEVTCANAYTSGLFKEMCVILVNEGAPAWGTSTATLNLNKVRALYKMGDGDIRVAYKWARFQFANNMDTQSSLILGEDDVVQTKVDIGGNEGTTKIQEFIVDKTAAKLQFKLVLDSLPLKTGPAVWGAVQIAPVGCVPPK